MKKLVLLIVGVAGAFVAYEATKKFLEDEKNAEFKQKLISVADEKKELLLKQKENIEEKITQLATKMADNSKELLDKGVEYAQEKKQAIVESIEEAKKTIQEEKERLKEVRARLHENEFQEEEVL